MNLGAHITIAAALYGDPEFHLGAAMPDIATIGGFRMVPNAGVATLGDGIAFHHATDNAFHSHPWFTSRQKSVFHQLSTDGVGRGAARASAHVGVELLLDGELFAADRGTVRSETVATAFAEAAHAHGIADLVPQDRRADWQRHISQLPRWRSPEYFRDPALVAERMQVILNARPRLAMRDVDVDKVADALSAVQASIAATAEDFVAEMVLLLAEPAT